MGRAKMNMELIRKEKGRQITLQKRKDALVRKMREFTTLCDVQACVVILNPNQENSSSQSQPEVWPQKPEDLSLIINGYMAKSKDKANRVIGLPDFFNDRKRKIQAEIQKVRKTRRETKYPTGMEPMSYLHETQLREFASGLKSKIDSLSPKLESMKELDQHPQHYHHPIQQQFEYNDSNSNTTLPAGWIDRSNGERELTDRKSIINRYYANAEHEPYHASQDPMIGPLMKYNYHQNLDHQVQLFGLGSHYNFHRASFLPELYLPPGGPGSSGDCGLIQNGVLGHPMPLSLHHGQAMQPFSIRPYMQSATTNIEPNLHSIRENDYNHVFHFQ